MYHTFQVSKVQMMTQHKKYSGEEHDARTETILESHFQPFSKQIVANNITKRLKILARQKKWRLKQTNFFLKKMPNNFSKNPRSADFISQYCKLYT